MKQYDTTFIIDGSLDQAQREGLIEKFEKSLEKLGGKLDRTVRWGLRALAYEIKKRTHGYYVMFYFNAEPAVIKKFETELNLNEYILRYMTLLFDGKHPDYIKDETGHNTDTTASKVIPEPQKEKKSEVSDEEVSEVSEVSEVAEVAEVAEDTPENDETGNVEAEETGTEVQDTDNETGEAAEAEDTEKKEAK